MSIDLERIEVIKELRREDYSEEDYRLSSECEWHVKNELERISKGELKLKFIGFGAGIPKKFEQRDYVKKEKKLDLQVRCGRKIIGVIEVQRDNKYTYEGSGFFSIFQHKVDYARKYKVPSFFVYILTKEQPWLTFWLSLKELLELSILTEDIRYVKGVREKHRFYPCSKEEWYRGLESLAEQLLTLCA